MAQVDSALPPLSENQTLYDAFDSSAACDALPQVSSWDILWASFCVWIWPIISWGLLFLQVYQVYHHLKARWDINKTRELYLEAIELHTSAVERHVKRLKEDTESLEKCTEIAAECKVDQELFKFATAEFKRSKEEIEKRLATYGRVGGPVRVVEDAMVPLDRVLGGLQAWNRTMGSFRRAVDSGALEGNRAREAVEALEGVGEEMKERVRCFAGCLFGLSKALAEEGDEGTAEYLKAWLPGTPFWNDEDQDDVEEDWGADVD